ncbi:hypothetical protein K469DRAFT_689820 [Zopfia rhizophila CBS 207.26]|uniref:Uncharacterized protein n=1 Tax=Zopfia rhizophila CBS 207.26 TaxID=1314779 RepID=A0A6A6E1A7_9PEZI|nr:hypothetical protein K469DRAFT_689820 [Zopfia rhizophila CBS 207.26]
MVYTLSLEALYSYAAVLQSDKSDFPDAISVESDFSEPIHYAGQPSNSGPEQMLLNVATGLDSNLCSFRPDPGREKRVAARYAKKEAGDKTGAQRPLRRKGEDVPPPNIREPHKTSRRDPVFAKIIDTWEITLAEELNRPRSSLQILPIDSQWIIQRQTLRPPRRTRQSLSGLRTRHSREIPTRSTRTSRGAADERGARSGKNWRALRRQSRASRNDTTWNIGAEVKKTNNTHQVERADFGHAGNEHFVQKSATGHISEPMVTPNPLDDTYETVDKTSKTGIRTPPINPGRPLDKQAHWQHTTKQPVQAPDKDTKSPKEYKEAEELDQVDYDS